MNEFDSMMNYIEIQLTVKPSEDYVCDVLAAYLGEIGFESFEMNESGMLAYVSDELFDEDMLKNLIANFPYTSEIQYKINEIEQINWNEEWEKHYFEPIIVDDLCVIHSSFHQNIPVKKYDIIIDPKMAFGTGHHETTSLMISEILKTDVKDKSVLDMGCGTAVLAILAAMKGAHPVTAIDIDDWCTENSVENIQKNKVDDIHVELGDAALLQGRSFDIIFANINRNILLADIAAYSQCLSEGGLLFMSGFYQEDIPLIKKEAELNGLEMKGFNKKNNWVAVKTVKLS